MRASTMTWRITLGALLTSIAASACADTSAPTATPAAAVDLAPTSGPYHVTIDPADFVSGVDNPYFPLVPGTTFVYEGVSDGEKERDVVNVTHQVKEIAGVDCVVVRDVVSSGGKVAEKTFDWYAQDRDGNVWYFGEDSTEYRPGRRPTTAGSWQTGVNGAQPGILMPAEPDVGAAYRQEYLAGEAEDMAQVTDIDGTARSPYGTFDHAVVTREWTPLQPRIVESKRYAPGVGIVLETSLKGPVERSALVSVTKS